jgi:hypothetical protein
MMDTSTPLILKCISLEGKEPISEIKKWFALLQKERGWRAELRRADVPESLLLCAGVCFCGFISYSLTFIPLLAI